MIIFKRLPDGTWEKSGAILPTETHYRIAVDALDPEKEVRTCADAIAEVERRIEAGTDFYRAELAMPPAKFLKPAPEAAEKTVKRILKAKKKETGKQRRARLKREGLCTACGKRKARKGKCECKTCNDYYTKWATAKAKKAAKR
jgi:hypothetical protein